MMSGRSIRDFSDWLSGQVGRGVLNAASLASYRTAANQIFDLLTDEEMQDVTKIDLDDVIRRFRKERARKYEPITLDSYEGRVRAAHADFLEYVANSGHARSAARPEPVSTPQAHATSAAVPIQIRSDLTVYVQGLPFDLTAGEAKKISNVVLAMAAD